MKITDRRDTDTDTDFAERLRKGLIQHRQACGLTNAEVSIEVTVGDITVLDSVHYLNYRPSGTMEIALSSLWDDSIREIPICWKGYVEAIKFLLDLAARKEA